MTFRLVVKGLWQQLRQNLICLLASQCFLPFQSNGLRTKPFKKGKGLWSFAVISVDKIHKTKNVNGSVCKTLIVSCILCGVSTSSPSSPNHFCLWLVELSADCVHSPTGLWLGSSLISNPVEVFPVFVWSLKQISWKYKLSHKPQDRERRKMFQHMAGFGWGELQTVIYTLGDTARNHWVTKMYIMQKAAERLHLYTSYNSIRTLSQSVHVMSLRYNIPIASTWKKW